MREEIISQSKQLKSIITNKGIKQVTKSKVQILLRIGMWRASEIIDFLCSKGFLIEQEHGVYKTIK